MCVCSTSRRLDEEENVTTLDRLAALWPDKPITFGEFGYTTGVPMGGDYLDRYTASVGEIQRSPFKRRFGG